VQDYLCQLIAERNQPVVLRLWPHTFARTLVYCATAGWRRLLQMRAGQSIVLGITYRHWRWPRRETIPPALRTGSRAAKPHCEH